MYYFSILQTNNKESGSQKGFCLIATCVAIVSVCVLSCVLEFVGCYEFILILDKNSREVFLDRNKTLTSEIILNGICFWCWALKPGTCQLVVGKAFFC